MEVRVMKFYCEVLIQGVATAENEADSIEEADEIIDQIKSVRPATYTPDRAFCDDILKSGDNVAVSQMIKLLRNMRKENRKNHKGLNIQEERILKDAERVFFSEMATAYDISMEEVVSRYGEILDA